MLELLAAERLTLGDVSPAILKGNDFINTSIHLFRCILNDQDPRWQIVQNFVEAKNEAHFRPIHVENALLATYLSNDPSYRNRYSSYVSAENIRHLCRAINNLRAYPFLRDMFIKTNDDVSLSDRFKTRFVRTDRILAGRNKEGVTGCPEALYQLRMFAEGRYIARVGFNVHPEGERMVFSIVNIQGVPNAKPHYQSIEDQVGSSPFNILVRRLRVLAEASQMDSTLRGLKNPKSIGSSGLYNTVFKSEGIKRFSFKRPLISVPMVEEIPAII